jgi:hypothetical protein
MGLVLPLLIASSVLLYLSRPISTRDVTLNLATDVITIIITVIYVDWVLHRHDEAAWQRAEKYIAAEAAAIANSFIRDVAEHLRIRDHVFPRLDSTDLQKLQLDVLSRVKRLDRFVIEDALSVLPKERWQTLIAIVEQRRYDSTPILSQYSSRMDPAQLESILEFRQQCSILISWFSIFGAYLGVPVSQLPKVKDGKPEEYTVLATIRIGMTFKDTFDACLSIVEAFEFHVDPITDDMEEFQASWDRWRERGGNAARDSS